MSKIDLSQDPFFKDFYYFQRNAVEASIKHLVEEKNRNGVIVQPTGSGKTYTLAGQIKVFAGDYQGRVVMVSHTKNIVDQDHKTAKKLWSDGKHLFGVNSAGLGRRDLKQQVLFTGIQSVYKSAKEIGEVNFLIPDECHAINMVDSVMYKKFIEDLYKINPNMRVGGLTAHDFRMTMGKIWGPSKDLLFDDLIYKANVKELIAQKYISKPINPPITEEKAIIDVTGVEIKRTGNDVEYDQKQLDERVNIPDKIKRQTKIVLAGSLPNESIAVFAHNIKHCELIAQSYIDQGEKSVAVVHSKIKGNEKNLIEAFKSGKIRVLVSVNMFVEGFDAPNIQVIDDRKPTASPGRYGQMGGRGFRICKPINKYSFKYFCFSGNVGLHGPLDQIESYAQEDKGEPPFKKCKGHGCNRFVHARTKICPYCGYIFPIMEREPEDRTNESLDMNSLISEPKWFTVNRLQCQPSKNKNAISAQYFCKGIKPRVDIEWDDKGLKWLKDHLGEQIPWDIKNFFAGGFRSKLIIPKKIFVDEAGLSSVILKYDFSGVEIIVEPIIHEKKMEIRPEILLHPNIPKPLHGLNPRTLMGDKWWDMKRKESYAKNDFHCWACGVHKRDAVYHQWLEGHECYKFDYKKGTAEMIEITALCHCCHNFIHNGRLQMLLNEGKIDEERFFTIGKHGMDVLKKAGLSLDAKQTPDESEIAEWTKWSLIIGGKIFKSKFKNFEEWKSFYNC